MQRTQRKPVHLAAALALAIVAWGCGDDGDSGGDVGRDAGPEDASTKPDGDAGQVDAGGDAGSDGGDLDGGVEEDGGSDAGDADGGADGGLDGGLDAGDTDGGLDGGEEDGGEEDAGFVPAPLGTGPLYESREVQSPLTPDIAAGLRAHVDAGPAREERVFAKVGDSISTGDNFMFCFADPAAVDLGTHADATALQETIAWFRAGDAEGTTPFDRYSLAAFIGALAVEIVEVYTRDGEVWDPPRLDQEVEAISPRFASVMLGTNDLGSRTAGDYARDLWKIVDTLLDEGVVPFLSTIPPREDTDRVPRAGPRVPMFNAIVRGLAQGKRIPLVDYHQRMLELPDHGLSSDGVHPSDDWSVSTCDFTGTGLVYGYNLRNLLTIEALDRVRRVVLEEEPAPQDSGIDIVGAGTAADPIQVPELPFGNLRDLATQGQTALASLSACTDAPGTGAGLVYRLELAEDGPLQAGAFTGPGSNASVRIHLLDAARSTCPAIDTCSWSDRNDPRCLRSYWLPAGRYDLVVRAATPADETVVLVAIVRP